MNRAPSPGSFKRRASHGGGRRLNFPEEPVLGAEAGRESPCNERGLLMGIVAEKGYGRGDCDKKRLPI